EVQVGDRKNMAFMTSYVTNGRGCGIVTATGMATEIGRIAALIHEAPEEETPLQKRLSDLGKVLSLTAVFLCALLFVLAVVQKRDVMEMLITAISLAVAAVPEGLPAVVTIVLALSVTRMVKAGTIVRRLPWSRHWALSVWCVPIKRERSQNEMTVTACYLMKNQKPRRLNMETGNRSTCFCLCNDATEETGDPTEISPIRWPVRAYWKERKKGETPDMRNFPLIPTEDDDNLNREGKSYSL
ncbi:MAG: ATPase, partial [Eisenbergiella sp.]